MANKDDEDYWDSQAAAANRSYRAGFDDAVNLHKGVVAAAQRIVDRWSNYNSEHADMHTSVVTLLSSLQNLKATLDEHNI